MRSKKARREGTLTGPSRSFGGIWRYRRPTASDLIQPDRARHSQSV